MMYRLYSSNTEDAVPVAHADTAKHAHLFAAVLSETEPGPIISVVDCSDPASREIVATYDRGILRVIGERW